MAKVKESYIPYAGMGDVDLPEDVREAIIDIANSLAIEGMVLRTRGEEGTDTAFMDGAEEHGDIEIYLPWENFNDIETEFTNLNVGAYEVAWKHHSAWQECEPDDRRFHAAGAQAILGDDLKSPCKFLLCYTVDGKSEGDTNNVIAIADSNLIPVFDLGLGIDYTLNRLEEWMEQNL